MSQSEWANTKTVATTALPATLADLYLEDAHAVLGDGIAVGGALGGREVEVMVEAKGEEQALVPLGGGIG